jgi:hypothetical protein
MSNEDINRKLHKIIEPDGCWHTGYHRCCNCGFTPVGLNPSLDTENFNPTYDNPAVIAEKMRERGLWTEFGRDLFNYHINLKGNHWYDLFEDLTTPALLAQAIISWHELTHVWKGDRYAEM